jgi:hypothetical protein
MAVKRYYFGLDIDTVVGTPTVFGSDTSITSSATFKQATKNITGTAGAVVTIKVTNYVVTNTDGKAFVNTIQKFLNDSFTVTLDGSGNGSFVAKVQGDSSQTGTIVTIQFTINGVTSGYIGSPSQTELSKSF